MKLRQAERITGHEIWRDYHSPRFTYFALDGVVEIARAAGATEKDALGNLVEAVYRIHGEIVRRKQGYLCARCAKRKPLSIHHKVFRSHGRSDVVGNLVALCSTCHESQHEGRS